MDKIGNIRFYGNVTYIKYIDVNGKNVHPIYNFLRAKLTGTLGSSIKWNFTKVHYW